MRDLRQQEELPQRLDEVGLHAARRQLANDVNQAFPLVAARLDDAHEIALIAAQLLRRLQHACCLADALAADKDRAPRVQDGVVLGRLDEVLVKRVGLVLCDVLTETDPSQLSGQPQPAGRRTDWLTHLWTRKLA